MMVFTFRSSDIFIKAKLCSSRKEFKRLLAQNALKINDVIITEDEIWLVIPTEKDI